MICPRCGTTQPDATDCVRCGVVVAKFLERRQKAEQADFRPPPPPQSLVQSAQPPAPPTPVQPTQAPILTSDRSSNPLKALWATRPPAERHRALFLQQLGRLAKAGVPLAEALATIRGIVGPARLGTLVAAAEAKLAAGEPFAAVMQALGPALDPLERELLVAAEAHGRLGPVAERLAERREAQAASGRPLLASLSYPALVAASGCVLDPLPLLVTQGAAAYSAKALGNLLLLGLVGAAAFLAVPWALSRPKLRSAGLQVGASLPGSRAIVTNRRYLLVFDAAERALDAGMQEPDVLRLASRASDEKTVERAADGQAKKLPLDGLASVLAELPGLDRESAGLLRAAHKSGTVPATLGELARQRQERYRGQLRLMAGGLRAVLIVVLLIGMSASLIGKFTETLTNPLGGLQGSEQKELQRELERAGLPVR